VIALGMDRRYEVTAEVASSPMCIDFLPDGRLLIVDSAQRRLLRREPGYPGRHDDLGVLWQYADDLRSPPSP
jgi:hypothetical protein